MKNLTLITLLFAYVASVIGLDHLLHYTIDDVSAGYYKYYSLMYDGIIKIRLSTQFGDADLYVSQINSKPTYEPDHYCLQSSTCGEDIIYIPPSFKRPVNIGVYGHPSHETSRYTLLVYQVIETNEDIFDKINDANEDIQGINNPKKEKTSFVLTLLWSLIDLLFYVLF